MATEGIEAVFLETRNWGKAARFFQDLGFTLEFDTGHSSGQLRNGDGPYVFIAEVPPDRPPRAQIVLKVANERGVPSRSRRRRGPGVGGHPLRHPGDDRPRSRRPDLDPPGVTRRRRTT